MRRVATYYYFYDSGTQPNRRIEFFSDNGNITARVSAFREGTWSLTSNIPGNKIIVEMQSTTEKVRAITEARETGASPKFDNQPITSIKDRQTEILTHLAPKGPWRITIENDVAGPTEYEEVLSLKLYNPS